MDIIQKILKDSNYHLSLFSDEEINSFRDNIFTKTVKKIAIEQDEKTAIKWLEENGEILFEQTKP